LSVKIKKNFEALKKEKDEGRKGKEKVKGEIKVVQLLEE